MYIHRCGSPRYFGFGDLSVYTCTSIYIYMNLGTLKSDKMVVLAAVNRLWRESLYGRALPLWPRWDEIVEFPMKHGSAWFSFSSRTYNAPRNSRDHWPNDPMTHSINIIINSRQHALFKLMSWYYITKFVYIAYASVICRIINDR